MTTRVTRTYKLICPSCASFFSISKSSSSIFGSLELQESDFQRCVNCQTTICSTCAKQGLCQRCFARIPPKLNETFDSIKLISRFVPIFISIIVLIIFIVSNPRLFILWIFVNLVISSIFYQIGIAIGNLIRNSKIKDHFPNQKSEYMPFLPPLKPEKRKEDYKLKAVILKISRTQQNKKNGLDFFGLESDETSPKVIRETFIDMIKNNEIKAQLDETQRYVTFF